MRSEAGEGSGRRRMELTRLKTVVLAPMQMARVRVAAYARKWSRRRLRAAYSRSWGSRRNILLRPCASQRRGGEGTTEPHGFDRRGGDDDHGAALLDGLVEHVHGAQVERRG